MDKKTHAWNKVSQLQTSEVSRFCRETHGFQFNLTVSRQDIEVTSWLVSADDFSSRVARGANERVSAANE